MTREEVYASAAESFRHSRSLALELPTGMGKSRMAIGLVNTVCAGRQGIKVLLLVAKTVHKQNWKDEIKKWGGFVNAPTLTIECYESLKNLPQRVFPKIRDEAAASP